MTDLADHCQSGVYLGAKLVHFVCRDYRLSVPWYNESGYSNFIHPSERICLGFGILTQDILKGHKAMTYMIQQNESLLRHIFENMRINYSKDM